MMALLCSEVVKVDRTATAAGPWSVRGAAQIHALARRRATARVTIRADGSSEPPSVPATILWWLRRSGHERQLTDCLGATAGVDPAVA